MLMYIRDRATGWIAWVIVILISIPFALWGVNEYLGPSQNVAVATVNGQELGYQEFQRVSSRNRDRLIRFLGSAASPELLDDERIRAQALEQMLDEAVILQSARSTGMRIADEQLAYAINSEPAFQQDGRFDQTLYENFLRTQAYSPAGFEFELRRSMLMDQWRAALQQGAILPGSVLDRILSLRDQKRRYRSLRIAKDTLKPAQPDAAVLQSYYEEHKRDFATPATVKLLYIEVLKDDVAKAVPVTEEELERRYEAQKASLIESEQREASHILLELTKTADEAEVEAAQESARQIKAQLDAGESFEDLAKALSEDPGSAKLGGSLGWFGRGVMDVAFEQAAFALAADEISDPVRSDFGIHLIKVTGVQEARPRTFEEVRDDLATEYRQEIGEQEFLGQAERIAEAAFENSGSLEPVAAAVDATVQESPPLSRDPRLNPEGIGRIPQVLEQAFSDTVLRDGNNSELLEIGDDRVIVLRVLEYEAAKERSFDEARRQILAQWTEDQAQAAAKAKGEELLARLRNGEGLDAVGEGMAAQWSDPKLVGRAAIAGPVGEALFSLPHPAEGQKEFHGLEIPSGDYELLALDRVVDGEPSEIVAGQRDQLQAVLAGAIGQGEYDAVVRGLRDAAEITVHDQDDN